MRESFPPRLKGKIYLTEGGTETEILYKWGFELPEFAMFPLLDNAEADMAVALTFNNIPAWVTRVERRHLQSAVWETHGKARSARAMLRHS